MNRYRIEATIFLSGFINLSAELLFQRILFQLVGHGIRTQSVLFLSFILGCGLGALAVTRFRFRPGWIELLVGAFNAVFALLLISAELYQSGLSLAGAFLLVLPSGFALGSLLPLYSEFAEQRYAKTYAVFHCGALIGLFAFEFWILNLFNYSSILGGLGVLQMLFGLAILRLRSPKPVEVRIQWTAERSALAKIVLFTAAAFYLQSLFAVWLTQLFGLTRINLSLVLLALMTWQSLGALVADLRDARKKLLILAAVVPIFLMTWVNLLPLSRLGLRTENSTALIFFIFLLCLIGTSVSMIAAWYFSDRNNGKPLIYIGWTSFVSAVGSLIGGTLFYLTSTIRVEPVPAIALLLGLVFVALVSCFAIPKTHQLGLGAVGLLVLIALGWSYRNASIGDIYTRGPYMDLSVQYTRNQVWASPDSVHALVYGRRADQPKIYDYIDGHQSHELTHFREVLVGLLGQQFFFDGQVERSLIIGIGSGQTLSGLLGWSNHVDAVDISENAILASKSAAEFNNDVMNNPRKTVFTMDGIQYIKGCEPESYDFILLTPTPIGLLHSTKLFSMEFLTSAKRCLKQTGVLMTWFDFETVQRERLLASILKTTGMVFRNTSVSLSPYPILLLSDDVLIQKSEIQKGIYHPKIEPLARLYNRGIRLIDVDPKQLDSRFSDVRPLTLDESRETYGAEIDYYEHFFPKYRYQRAYRLLLKIFPQGYLPDQFLLQQQEELLVQGF
jgi:spermidine synthase